MSLGKVRHLFHGLMVARAHQLSVHGLDPSTDGPGVSPAHPMASSVLLEEGPSTLCFFVGESGVQTVRTLGRGWPRHQRDQGSDPASAQLCVLGKAMDLSELYQQMPPSLELSWDPWARQSGTLTESDA